MIRPRKMKRVELSILARDVDAVIEYLGRRPLLHFADGASGAAGGSASGTGADESAALAVREKLEKIRAAASALGVEGLPEEPGEKSAFPGAAEAALVEDIGAAVSALREKEAKALQEKRGVEEALNEARAFSGLNAPFSDLDQLSYLTLRVGRLDPKRQGELAQALDNRAVVIPLDGRDGGDRVLAAASRKGRFALDSELQRLDFAPIKIPEGYKGVPRELLAGLEERLGEAETALAETAKRKAALREEYGPQLAELAASYLMAEIAASLKAKLKSTKSAYFLAGWVPAAQVPGLVGELERLTGGSVAVRTYEPEEIAAVEEGAEKVPVSLEHGAFVRGFQGVVLSYGAPLYGTIDPTPLVAVFFTLLFGIMFGDSGQGLVLFLAGLLTSRRGPKALAGFRAYSTPLIAVGIAAMAMGLLTGEFFTSEELFVRPTRAVTQALFGAPMDRFLTLMPLAEKGGSVAKLFAFFGFTLGIGVILNSSGLLVNIINLFTTKKYEKALFSKTGIAGTALFWYALYIAVRSAVSLTAGKPLGFYWFDAVGLALPCALIFFGPALWRLVSGERPVLEEGLMVFVMEGFVEMLETASTYLSNTVSFLRVGAFALSHGVLSYIVFTFYETVHRAAGGPAFSLLIMVFGNALIILLEGMIVAIQVVRLQYYEFFSKFFTETGVEFVPFAFRKKGSNN
ncbi:MAG: V/A type ATP synthase; V/A-type H+/Na+-transporting ATPase subunit I [Treponematales bacterium]